MPRYISGTDRLKITLLLYIFLVLLAGLVGISAIVAGGYDLEIGQEAYGVSSHEGQEQLLVDGKEQTAWHSSVHDITPMISLWNTTGHAQEIDHIELSGLENVDSVVVLFSGPGFEEGFPRSYEVEGDRLSITPLEGAKIGITQIIINPIDQSKPVQVGEVDYAIK